MFKLQKLKNWTHSSVNDDRNELNIYQSFQDQFSSINSKIEEYIEEVGREDSRLLIDYNGQKMTLEMLKILSESVMRNKDLSVQERAFQSAELSRAYHENLKLLKEKIISLAVIAKDNVYLAYINSYIQIINAMLKEYAYLLAVQRSGVRSIDNTGELNAGQKIGKLKDNIDIRTAEINSRLSLENCKRR